MICPSFNTRSEFCDCFAGSLTPAFLSRTTFRAAAAAADAGPRRVLEGSHTGSVTWMKLEFFHFL